MSRTISANRTRDTMWRFALWRRLRTLARDDRGVTAVEFVFVAPILILILGGILQFGLILYLQNHMNDVARDVSRRVAVAELSETEGEAAAQDALINWGVTYSIDVEMPDPNDPNDRDIDVTISVPMAEASLIDILGLFQSGDLTASVTMRQE